MFVQLGQMLATDSARVAREMREQMDQVPKYHPKDLRCLEAEKERRMRVAQEVCIFVIVPRVTLIFSVDV